MSWHICFVQFGTIIVSTIAFMENQYTIFFVASHGRSICGYIPIPYHCVYEMYIIRYTEFNNNNNRINDKFLSV